MQGTASSGYVIGIFLSPSKEWASWQINHINGTLLLKKLKVLINIFVAEVSA